MAQLIPPKLVEVFDYDGPACKPLVYFKGWRVAILNDDPKFRRATTPYLESHQLTDEAFVLLKGECSLYIGDGGEDHPGNISLLKLEPLKIYNVKRGVWHNLEMTPDTSLLIVENANTSKTNSRFYPVTPEMLPLP